MENTTDTFMIYGSVDIGSWMRQVSPIFHISKERIIINPRFSLPLCHS